MSACWRSLFDGADSAQAQSRRSSGRVHSLVEIAAVHLAAGDAGERVEPGKVFVDGDLLAEAVLQGSGGGFCGIWVGHGLSVVMAGA